MHTQSDMSEEGAKKKSVWTSWMPELDNDSRITLAILGCFAGGAFFLITMLGIGGSVGAVVKNFCQLMLGWVAYLIPVTFFVAAAVLINLQKHKDLEQDLNNRLFWGLAFVLIAITGFLSLFSGVSDWNSSVSGGGAIGFLIYPTILGPVGPIVAAVFLFLIATIGFFLTTNMTFVQFTSTMGAAVREPSRLFDFVPEVLEFWKKNPRTQQEKVVDELGNLPNAARPVAAEEEENNGPVFAKVRQADPVKKKSKPVFSFNKSEEGVIEFKKSQAQSIQNRGWGLPPFDILKDPKGVADPGDVEGNKEVISNTLDQFGIKVEMGEVIVGPTVTQYTLKPANGVRLSAIDNLQRDLALALAAPNIRIMPIPGKTLIGVEVPNTVMSEVRLKTLFQTTEFVDSDNLTVAIGKDVAGKNLFYSVTKMPHILVAGATGSGKSVWINSLLLSLLFKYSPSELELVLVDMKRVELKLYEGIPHLLTSVITEAEKAINALKWTVLEMDRRYQLLEEHGKRNITDYNAYTKDQTDLKPLPYIVFIIDELADLMMMAKAEVEPIVARLTQMSRAVGIHMVLGTQRPDTSVITGLIKANVPTRLAFAVASQIDSRVILDNSGAEKLLGKGDGMFLSPTNISPVRFQGANVDESEVRETVNYLKSQLHESKLVSNNNESVIQQPKQKIKIPGLDQTTTVNEDGEEVDEMYEEAKKIVTQYQKASASFLQQTMGIGYPKAARIIMELENNGIVGPANGSKPREVYTSTDTAY
jgi:DNA segregation ATPase FtsK/SpoIIIE, S-DNA-T family